MMRFHSCRQRKLWISMPVALRVVLPLVVGLGCYGFFRPDSRFFLGWTGPWMKCAGWFGNAPDPLWAYAFCQALFLTSPGRITVPCLIVLSAGTGFELLQGPILPGSPSLSDMLCYLGACSFAALTPPNRLHQNTTS